MESPLDHAHMEDWYLVVPFPGGSYSASLESLNICLYGKVYGHYNFSNGDVVITSRIIGWNPIERYVYTDKTKYTLGKVSEEYEKNYPGTFEKMFNVKSNSIN